MKYLLLLLLISATFAEVSLYRGVGTYHLFVDNSQINNDNAVTVIKVDDVLAGTMINSYGEDGYFVGYMPQIIDSGRLEVTAGLVAIQGYRRWQVPYYSMTRENYLEKVTTAAVAASISYDLTDSIAAQCNNMMLVVLNCGLRVDF